MTASRPDGLVGTKTASRPDRLVGTMTASRPDRLVGTMTASRPDRLVGTMTASGPDGCEIYLDSPAPLERLLATLPRRTCNMSRSLSSGSGMESIPYGLTESSPSLTPSSTHARGTSIGQRPRSRIKRQRRGRTFPKLTDLPVNVAHGQNSPSSGRPRDRSHTPDAAHLCSRLSSSQGRSPLPANAYNNQRAIQVSEQATAPCYSHRTRHDTILESASLATYTRHGKAVTAVPG
ncbi:hypothetical protein RRG08_060144 [Elysia crispata]|uniref:Uncharacterized protein n=1 Tax=Elysia crispata TaxID=231223 RepID=A0AAE1DPT4_9GAST|nr:hypothetical protein RRG08_060144 [Elysia crispata]